MVRARRPHAGVRPRAEGDLDCWQNGTKLDFRGDFYNFNLMPPFFNPGPIENPNIKVYVAAVNSRMQRVAGEVSDGVLLHSFNTPKFTQEVILPKLEAGATAAGRSLADLEVSGGGFIVTGATEEEIESSRRDTKRRISFYASTRSYAPVMHAHGWHDAAEKLYRMSIDGQWDRYARADHRRDAGRVRGGWHVRRHRRQGQGAIRLLCKLGGLLDTGAYAGRRGAASLDAAEPSGGLSHPTEFTAETGETTEMIESGQKR